MPPIADPASDTGRLRTEAPSRAVLRLRPAGVTLALAALILALLCGSLEAAARSRALQDRLPPESIGSGQPQLDKKLVLLRELRAKKGPVDILFVGSSQVYRAIDPALIEESYQRAAGRPTRTFNFGLGGMSETGEEPLAEILVDAYHPKLLVVGVSSYGLDARRDLKFGQFLDKSAWFRYHRGEVSLDGWLLEHSSAFRRWHGHLFWKDPPPDTLELVQRSVADMRPDGHSSFEIGKFNSIDPDTRKTLPDYAPSPRHLEALSDVLALRRPGLEVVLVEMPVHETVIQLYGRGQVDHDAALDEIAKVAARRGVRFLRYPYVERPLPGGGWYDFIHLNRIGAQLYSRWLGEQLARVPLP